MKIVMLNGLARSGKDTAGSIFMSCGGYQRQSFAAPIREFIMQLCGFQDLQELDANKMTPMDILDGKTPRFAMQTLGTEWGRDKINSRLWTMFVSEKIEKAPLGVNTVITDLRFDSEYHDMVHFFPNETIQVYEIIRPENEIGLTGDAASHRSEAGLHVDIPRIKIYNDGSLEDFRKKIFDIV